MVKILVRADHTAAAPNVRAEHGTMLLLGYAHSGDLNTLDHVRQLSAGKSVWMVIGGMHLGSVAQERIECRVQKLRRFRPRVLLPMHCTGAKATAAFWTAFPDACQPGGAAKSTVTVNLAMVLALAGRRVGLLDVDIHGPAIPKMLRIENAAVEINDGAPQSGEKAGLKVMSIGLLLQNRDDAVIWCGPLKMSGISQFLEDVDWGDLDYLIIDSPPGTGDDPLCANPSTSASPRRRRKHEWICPSQLRHSHPYLKTDGGDGRPFLGRIPIDPAVDKHATRASRLFITSTAWKWHGHSNV
ncbi:MAG: P-loop NTPase [Kiritimatiellia bacterium]